MSGAPKRRARRAAQAQDGPLEAAAAPDGASGTNTAAKAQGGRQQAVERPGGLVWPDGQGPEFPGQRPPFAAGNSLAVTHGARSPRRVDPLATALVEAYLGDDNSGYLREPAYAAAVWAWARAEARVQLLDEYVAEMPMEKAMQSDRGQTSPLELLRKYEETASRHRARLGLDPMSRARLGRDVAATRVDLAAVLTQMRADAEATDTDTDAEEAP